MLDNGSTISFCTSKLVKDLNLDTFGETEMEIRTVLGPKKIKYNTTNLQLFFPDGSFAVTLFLYVIDARSLGSVPAMKLPAKKLIDDELRNLGKQPSFLKLTEKMPRKNDDIDVLVGLDFLMKIYFIFFIVISSTYFW